MPDRSTLAKIHIAKKALKLDDIEYRGLLSVYDCESSKDLTDTQAYDLLLRFEKLGWQPTPSKPRSGRGKLRFEHLRSRGKGFAKPAQLRKIEAIWREIARDKSDQALAHFIERQTAKSNQVGISNIEWLKDHHAHTVLSALQRMQIDYKSQLDNHE